MVGTATVLNPSASPISATAGILDQWHVTTFAGSSQDQQRDITGNVNLAGNSSEIISLQGIGPIFSFLFKDQTANLASVIGTGSLQALTVNVATLVDPNLYGGIAAYSVNAGTAVFQIGYTYDSVPEPGAGLLVVAGGVFVFGSKRL